MALTETNIVFSKKLIPKIGSYKHANRLNEVDYDPIRALTSRALLCVLVVALVNINKRTPFISSPT